MLELLHHTLIDTVKLIPFLFIAFLLIELIEHRFSDKTKRIISKSGRFGPILGGILGAFPQCGFSVLATNLYVTRIITLGTLVAIYLSTSDEMIPILLSHNVPIIEIVKLVGLKVVIGIIFGIIIDFFYRKKNRSDFHICDESDCHCEESILKSSVIHTLKTLLFIFIITFALNALFHYVDSSVIENIFLSNSIFGVLIGSLIGLIPNCGASIMLTELYINGVISLGMAMAGLLTGSGVAILVLFKTNKNMKENLAILALVYVLGVIGGIAIDFVGALI